MRAHQMEGKTPLSHVGGFHQCLVGVRGFEPPASTSRTHSSCADFIGRLWCFHICWDKFGTLDRDIEECQLLDLMTRLGRDVTILVGPAKRRPGRIELHFI